MRTVSGTDIIEEAAYVLLKQDDDGKGANADKLVEDAAQQLHLENLADDNPATDEEQDAIEDVDGARLLHQLVAIEEHNRYKENVDDVFEVDCWHRCNLLFDDSN